MNTDRDNHTTGDNDQPRRSPPPEQENDEQPQQQHSGWGSDSVRTRLKEWEKGRADDTAGPSW